MISRNNPWMLWLMFVAFGSLVAGIVGTSSRADPASDSYDPVWAALGPALVVVGGVMVASALAAGAINWQQRRRYEVAGAGSEDSRNSATPR